MKSEKTGINVILTALFASLISASCFVQIPLPGGIPIIIQDMMCALAGLLLGPVYGVLSVVIFLFLGCLGLPVFRGHGGIQHLIGSTCGFFAGYVLMALVGGLILAVFLPIDKECSKAKAQMVISLAAIAAMAIMFACGIWGFMFVTGAGLKKAVASVLIPFIPGTIVKLILITPLTYKFRPVIFRYKTSK